MSFRAIETEYRGYRMRSRLEARWAVFFDALNVEWLYEHEGFDLGELGRYLPDFWFPVWECYGEVKPKAFTKQEYVKCAALPRRCLLLEGVPSVHHGFYCASDSNTEPSISFADYKSGDTYWRVLLWNSAIKRRLWFLFGERTEDNWAPDWPDIAARSARFEYGESGHRPRKAWPGLNWGDVQYGKLPY